MPTGIPRPAFGLDETVASVYGDANYYTHWVDNTHPNTGASGNGTPSNPRSTFPAMTSLAAGSVVQVRGGTYSLSANMQISASGTSNSPVFITTGGTASVTIDLNTRQIQIGGSYTIFEGFRTIDRDEAIACGGTSCVVRRCEIIGTGTAVDNNGSMISGGGSTNFVAAWNTVRDGGIWQSTSENDMHALGVGGNQHDTWYLWNTVYHCGGDGCGNGHDANHTTSGLYIGGNEFYECRENAIDLKEVHDVIISENHCHHFVAAPGSPSTSPGEAIVIHYGPTTGDGPYNCWILNNIIHDCTMGIVSSNVQGTGSWWIGNLVYDCSIALNPDRGGGIVRCYHNTIVDCGVGISVGGNGQALTQFVAQGNLVVNANTTSGYHMEVFSSNVRPVSTVTNECYYQGGSNVRIYWGTNYTSVAAWISGTTAGDNSIQADPLFTNQAGDIFTLQAGSPCIGAGVSMAAVEDTFQSLFPGKTVSLLADIDGTDRPDGVWDIGAYQRP